MAKKVIKKAAAKKDSRGRKPGQKVGPYKKTLKDDNKQPVDKTQPKTQTVEETETQTNESTVDSDSNNRNTANNSSDHSEQVNGEKLFEEFVNEEGAEEEYKEEETHDETTEEEEEEEEYTEDTKPLKPSVKKLINGRTLLAFCDAIIPGLLMKLLNMIDKDMKDIKGRDIKLTAEQKEDMKEVADEVAAMIFDKIDPLSLFFIMLFVNYYANAQIKAMEKLNIPVSIVEEEREAA